MKLIAQKRANALVDDAVVKPEAIEHIPFANKNVFEILGHFRNFMGGLWVGGTLSLFNDSLHFEANDINKELQTGTLSIDIPLHSIEQVSRRFGVFTGIIDVHWMKDSTKSLNSFRCFNSKHFFSTLQDVIQATKSE